MSINETERSHDRQALLGVGFAAALCVLENLAWLLRARPYVPSRFALAAGDAISSDGEGIYPEALSAAATWTIWTTQILIALIGLAVCWRLYRVINNMVSGRLLDPSTAIACRWASHLVLIWIIVDQIGTTFGNNLVYRDLGMTGPISSYDLTKLVWGYLVWALLLVSSRAISRAQAAEEDLEGVI